MYKVLIAEDELFVRLGIKNSVRWEEYGMEVMADVKDGQAAWCLMEQSPPDILITDILMPAMDGKQLVKKVFERYADIYIIVISCLEDFETVHRLLRNGIKDYLLKSTMTEHQIGQSLEKARNFLEKYGKSRAGEDMPTKTEHREYAMQQYLSGKITAEQLCIRLQMGKALAQAPFILAISTIDAVYETGSNGVPPEYRTICRNTLDLLSNRTYPRVCHQAFVVDDRHLALLLFPSGIQEEACREDARQAVERMNSDIQNFLSIYMSFHLFLVPGGIQELHACYRLGMQAVHRHYMGKAGATVCTWECAEDGIRHSLGALFTHQEEISRYLTTSVLRCYCELLEEFPRRVMQSQAEMVFVFKSLLNLFRPWIDEGDRAGAGLSDAFSRCNRVVETVPFLADCTAAVCDFLSQWEQVQKAVNRYARIEIVQALQFMEEHIADSNITLSSVASHVGLSETYFSGLFRHETGIPFIKYLCNIRVERAKGLLRDTNGKIITIAAQSGFSEDTYFSRVFKKATGMSPSEWRHQCQ